MAALKAITLKKILDKMTPEQLENTTVMCSADEIDFLSHNYAATECMHILHSSGELNDSLFIC